MERGAGLRFEIHTIIPEKRNRTMRKILLSLAAPVGVLLGVLALGGCTTMNNCTGNGFENAEYCTGTLHPNAGPYAWHNEAADKM